MTDPSDKRRGGRFVPRSLAPFERYPHELASLRVGLGQLLDHHVDLAFRTIGAGGQLFVVDLWMMGVAQRSFHLLEGFLQSFDAWNVTVAAPLVRFQIENLYRTDYLRSDPNGPDVVTAIMEGTEFRKLAAFDDPKARLTDRVLVDRASKTFPWIKDVYHASNAWVHLSDRHIFNAHKLDDVDQRTVVGRIPMPLEWIPVSFLEELLGAMSQATRDLFALFEAWEEWKLGHPTAQ